MKLIDREMTATETTTTKGETSLYCQASFNSQGYITLRNYNIEDKNSDEIIILSGEETQAIVALFSRLGAMFRNNTLPF